MLCTNLSVINWFDFFYSAHTYQNSHTTLVRIKFSFWQSKLYDIIYIVRLIDIVFVRSPKVLVNEYLITSLISIICLDEVNWHCPSLKEAPNLMLQLQVFTIESVINIKACWFNKSCTYITTICWLVSFHKISHTHTHIYLHTIYINW